MARGPFQGTWQQGVRPTVVTAPDALVYINGETDIVGCPSCRRRFDWNKYITSITTEASVESSPGSASINLSVPRHAIDDLYFDGTPLISPMMEVEIYSKGYYTVEGVPQYYPIFWGLVTDVSKGFSNGEHTLSINCADILKWWEICKMNINPAFTQTTGQAGRSIFGNVFFGMNPYDVIWTLAQQSFGDVIVGTGSLVSVYKEPQQKATFNSALGDIMQYWNKRFSKIRSNLLLYGTTGTAVRGDVIQAAYQSKKPQFGKPFVSQLVRQANGNDSAQLDFDPTDPAVVAYRTQFSQAGQVNFWQSEYQTKLELANAAKEAIGFEFYMDVTGEIVFKPPFYNLDTLSNKPISWIQAIDIIDWDLSESEAEVVTQIQLQGNYGGNVDYGFPEETVPYTSVTDYHLLRKYGWRSHTYNSEFMANPLQMFYVGLDLLDRMNSKRFRANITIPHRPELRLGFPIYLAPEDQMWYIQGISHNVAFGSRATTTLTLTAKREKFKAPSGIGAIKLVGYKGPKEQKPKTLLASEGASLTTRQLSTGGQFKADVGRAAEIPPSNYAVNPGDDDPYAPLILRHPKTGRVVGYPNVVLAYTRPFQATPETLAKLAGQKPSTDPRTAQSKVQAFNKAAPDLLNSFNQYNHTATADDQLREKHLTNRYSYGLNSAGVYTYLHDQSKVVKEMLLLPSKNIDFGNSSLKFQGATGMIRPVSDERGFEVIGHHRYGRGVSLRDGSLVLSLDGGNTKANIGTQLALGGGLYETLQAQSQGLTTVSTAYTNPADAVARMGQEALQTAGMINPETQKPEFTNTDTTFTDTATLNSAEQKGAVVDVEASQLSKALTLAEMQVKDSYAPASKDCICLTGRADLAFLNVGYQIKVIRPTTLDDTKIPASNSLLEEALNDGTPVSDSAATPSRDQLINRVEAFLSDLYRALDDPHQQYEKELRGELIKVPTAAPGDIRFGQNPTSVDDFAPPYSTPNRAAGGDPAALAVQAETALNQASSAWSQFSGKLKSNAQKAELQGLIDKDMADITRLQEEQQRLQEAVDNHSIINGDTAAALKTVTEDLAKAEQSLANHQGKLNLVEAG